MEACRLRANRHMGSWAGTAGTLAADVRRLLWEVERLSGIVAGRPAVTLADRTKEAHAMTPAEQLLQTAIATVAQRRATYGPPREHFAKTVAAVNAIFSHKLREPFTEADWAQVMILDKLARHQGTARSADTPVDLAGYAACLAECEA
jgi:hypothetical protein